MCAPLGGEEEGKGRYSGKGKLRHGRAGASPTTRQVPERCSQPCPWHLAAHSRTRAGLGQSTAAGTPILVKL